MTSPSISLDRSYDNNNVRSETRKRKKEDQYKYSLSEDVKAQLPLFLVSFILRSKSPETLQDKRDFVSSLQGKISYPLSESSESEAFKIWVKYCSDLIFYQSSNIEIFAALELVSNAIDATNRAGKKTPVVITCNEKRLIVEDSGDGMGWKQLPFLLIPGLSSNKNAIFNREESLQPVGRWATRRRIFADTHR